MSDLLEEWRNVFGARLSSRGLIVVVIGLSFRGDPAVLPQDEPPQPHGPVINVLEHGADAADNDHDDTAAVNAALKAAKDDSTLCFPEGTYNIRWIDQITGFDGLSIRGDGPEKSVLKRMGPFWGDGQEHTYDNLSANYAQDSKVLRIEDCTNMCIRNMGFDANGTPTFGGVGIRRPKRLHITNTAYMDSREQPPLFGKDRYAWCILGYDQGAEDVWFTDNRVEGLQVEIDGCNRILVERNVLKRSVKSPGIGFLSGNFSGPGEFRKGYDCINVTVRRNYLSNADVLSMGMVTFQLDPSTNCDTVFRDIDIVDNVFVYDVDSAQAPAAIKLGTGDSSLKTKGNVFEKFRIERNRIYRKPDVNIVETFHAYIWFNCWAGEHRLNDTIIRDNHPYTDTGTKPLLKIGRENESRQLVMEANRQHPYQPPPEGSFNEPR